MRLLSEGLEETLRRHNHWWRGERIFGLPPVRRWAFPRLFSDICGKGLAAVTVLRGPSKLCLCDHILRAAWFQEVMPLAYDELERVPHLFDLSGRIAESTAGYFISAIGGLNVTHFPERGAEPEVDFVLTLGEQRIPLEVKYPRRIDYRDTIGLRAFVDKPHYNAPFGVLVTLTDEVASDDPRIISIPMSTLLLLR
jgi:predicted AAA+ superfamily ATPase